MHRIKSAGRPAQVGGEVQQVGLDRRHIQALAVPAQFGQEQARRVYRQDLMSCTRQRDAVHAEPGTQVHGNAWSIQERGQVIAAQ